MKNTEFWLQMQNVGQLPSCALDLCRQARDRFSSGEFAQLYRKIRPYTMSSNARLRGLYEAVRTVVADGIAGDVVECGTARGGSAALMGLTLNEMNDPRTLWVYDTFEGLPPATEDDPESAQLYTGKCRGNIEDVSAMFQKVGVLHRAKLVKGLVQDTLPISQAKTISVLHVDTDWYDSVRDCLVYLYDRVTPGGFIQIDDYGYWEGARKAVDEFLRNRGIDVKLKRLDYTGRQFVKPA